MKHAIPKQYTWKVCVGICAISLTLFLVFATPLEAYQLSRGDTLWTLSGKFLKNPFLWPRIWALNPTIRNPHWIYPGGKVNLKAPAPAESSRQIPRETVPVKPKVAKPAIRKTTPLILIHRNILAEGFISSKKIREVGRVLTNRDNTPMNAFPKDLCFYAREGQIILPGDHFSTFTYVKEINNQACRNTNYQIQLGGELEVYRVEGRFCFAKILYNYTEISKGDPIASFRHWPEKLVLTSFKKPLEGRIISMKERVIMGAQNKIIYINKGDKDGLQSGNMLSIYKNCPEAENPYHAGEKVLQPPDWKVGSLVILSTQPETATAMVLNSRKEIDVGDKIRP